jgi:hypothetical protein
MPGIDVDAYRSNWTGGAKSYLFYYKPIFPSSIDGDTEVSTYLVRSTTVPETAHEEITTNWQGFDFRQAGKAIYSDWSVTFNVDSKAVIHKTFNDWMRLIHDPTSNTYNPSSIYMKDQELEMLGLDGMSIEKIKLYGAWPKNIGPITLDYSQNDICTFDVTFAYIYHVSNNISYNVSPSFAG